MIEIGDLPPTVQRAIVAIPAEFTAPQSARGCRETARTHIQSVSAIYPTGQWHQVVEQLSIAIGYHVAAMRFDEAKEETP